MLARKQQQGSWLVSNPHYMPTACFHSRARLIMFYYIEQRHALIFFSLSIYLYLCIYLFIMSAYLFIYLFIYLIIYLIRVNYLFIHISTNTYQCTFSKIKDVTDELIYGVSLIIERGTKRQNEDQISMYVCIFYISLTHVCITYRFQ